MTIGRDSKLVTRSKMALDLRENEKILKNQHYLFSCKEKEMALADVSV